MKIARKYLIQTNIDRFLTFLNKKLSQTRAFIEKKFDISPWKRVSLHYIGIYGPYFARLVYTINNMYVILLYTKVNHHPIHQTKLDIAIYGQ